jgi:hypothetical protein
MLSSTHFSMNKGQSDRQRWKSYTYLHLTAAHMHDQPPGLPLLRHNMHALDLRRPSTLRRESQLSLRAGQHGSILNLPTPALHVGERSASLHVSDHAYLSIYRSRLTIIPRERGVD